MPGNASAEKSVVQHRFPPGRLPLDAGWQPADSKGIARSGKPISPSARRSGHIDCIVFTP
jgi:hypothetical protein